MPDIFSNILALSGGGGKIEKEIRKECAPLRWLLTALTRFLDFSA
jgi:hypothetical protein